LNLKGKPNDELLKNQKENPNLPEKEKPEPAG